MVAADLPDAKVHTPPGRGVDYLDTYAGEFVPHLVEFIDGLDAANGSAG